MINFPTYAIEKVWHVGMMDKSLKKSGSLEGSGLSVSECPLAWEEIAELGGNYFELTKTNGMFLDFHDLSVKHKEIIVHWGVENGFITLETLYKYIQFDEDGEEMYGLTMSYEDALEEVMGDKKLVITSPNSIVSTPTLIERVMEDSLVNVFDVLTTVYNEDVLGFDGVWFHDDLDRYSLSAPRGVIAINKLDSWSVKEIKENAVPTWGSRYED